MISLDDVYKVIVSMVPLYVALILGYGSVKWWRIFKPDQVDTINRLVCYFTLPLFNFDFTAHSDPFKWDYKFLAADSISKVIIAAVITIWARFSSRGCFKWSITSFSLSTMTNSLVVGVPLLGAMYGKLGVDLVVQFSVTQAIIWLTILLFVFESRRSRSDFLIKDVGSHVARDQSQVHSVGVTIADGEVDDRKIIEVVKVDIDVEKIIDGVIVDVDRPSIWSLMNVVGVKLIMNPNSYSCVIGIAWAAISSRCHFNMPSIIDGSITIMSKAGTGTAMFSMGMFMALQEKLISCGPRLTLYGMILKFIASPLSMAFGSYIVGLHGNVLHIAIIQAALPQSITSFIYAKEYGLHADVLSTAVIFGMMASLPILIGYYVVIQTLL